MKEDKKMKIKLAFIREYLEMDKLWLDEGSFGVDPVFRYNRKRNTKKIDWEYWEKHFKIIKDLL